MESPVKHENFWHSKKTVDKLLKKTSPRALEPKKSPSSLRRYELFKGLSLPSITHNLPQEKSQLRSKSVRLFLQ